MKIKAKEKKGVVTVKAMAKHPMLSYEEAKRKKTEANFITHMIATVGGATVFEMSSSQFLSANPYVAFDFHGKAGEEVVIKWVDLLGKTAEGKAAIK
jgi:sulfur-oxidizing protein SoxZ